MAVRTWSSAGSNDLNLATNYSGAGALLTTDDLVFDATSVVNATASSNLDVKSITVAAAYSGNMSFSGRTAIYENGNASFDGTGTINLGNGITLNGASATLHIGAGTGVVTATSCIVVMNGTTGMILDIDKASTYFKRLTLGAGAHLTHSGAQAVYLEDTITPLVFVNGGTLINNITLVIRCTGNGAMFSITGNPSISGTAPIAMRVMTAGTTVTIPAITATCNISMMGYAPAGSVTITQTGDIACNDLAILTNQANSYTFNSGGYSINAAKFSFGASNAAANFTLNMSSSIVSTTEIDGGTYNTGASIAINLQSSQWNCAGNCTFGNNHTVDSGTSKITFSKNSAITSNGELFNDVEVNILSADHALIALNQTSRNYHGVAVHPNGNVYAIVNVALNGVYMQTNGIGDFVLIWNVAMDFRALGISPNGDVYVGEYGGSIWVQTGGVGVFVELAGTTGNWHGITITPNLDVWAADYGGDIYRRTGGVGAFAATGQVFRNWRAIGAAYNGDVYATIYAGDIYKQTFGDVTFNALGQVARNWREINGAPSGDVYAVVNGGDIYKQTAGVGNFVGIGASSLAWHGIDFSDDGTMFVCVYGGDIYEDTNGIILRDAMVCNDITVTSGMVLGGYSLTSFGDALFSVNTTLFRLIMTKATDRTITVVAAGTLTFSNLTDTNLNAPAGALNIWRSSVTGTQFNISIPAIITLVRQNPQDCVSNRAITVDDGTSVNGGNDFNWFFEVIITSVVYLGNHRWGITGSGFLPAGAAPTVTIDGVAGIVEAGATDTYFVVVEGGPVAPGAHTMTVTSSGSQVDTFNFIQIASGVKSNHNIGVHIL